MSVAESAMLELTKPKSGGLGKGEVLSAPPPSGIPHFVSAVLTKAYQCPLSRCTSLEGPTWNTQGAHCLGESIVEVQKTLSSTL